MKMGISSRITVILVTLLLGGCETMDGGQDSSLSTQTSAVVSFPVEIVSDPSGAVVEINDDYAGKTPLTVDLEGWQATRTFARSHTIVAHPLQAGGYTQIKVFLGWYEASRTHGDTIPKTIYFNMRLVPSPEKYDIEINKSN